MGKRKEMAKIRAGKTIDLVDITSELDEACHLNACVRDLVRELLYGEDDHLVPRQVVCEAIDALSEKAGRLIEAQCPRLGYPSQGFTEAGTPTDVGVELARIYRSLKKKGRLA